MTAASGEPEDVNLVPTKVDSFAKGSPTRGAVTAKPVTERFNPDAVELCETERAPKTFFKKSRKKVKGICVSCIIESETAKIQHKTA